MNTAEAVFEAHHHGFRVTVRDALRHQIIFQSGLTALDAGRLIRAHHVPDAAVTVLPAQA